MGGGVTSITLRPFYLWARASVRIELEAVGSEGRSVCFTKDRHFILLPEIKPRFLGRPTHSLNYSLNTEKKK
jgi:hypothetical protein